MDFFSGLTGEVVAPGNPLYDQARQEWNRAVQKFPAAIVYCQNKYDVVHAVKWAVNHHIPLRIRSGGHNFEGYSNGDAVLVIDVSRLNGMKIENGLLRVEGGVNLQAVYGLLSPLGYPFPGGSCPTAGITGYTLGAGWGLSSRLYGLGCDSLLEAEMVDAKGRILAVNSSCNPDLFWALKGAGGGNFGVVTSMTFRLPSRVNVVTTVEFGYADASHEKQAEFLTAWQAWLKSADSRLTIVVSMYHSKEEGFGIYGFGLFYGPEAAARQAVKPLDFIRGGMYAYVEGTLEEAMQAVTEGYPPYEMFKSTGRFVMRPFNGREIYNLTGMLRDVPPGSDLTALSLYAMGGRIKDADCRDTAFFFRNAMYIAGIQSVWSDPKYKDVNTAWVTEKFRYLRGVTNGSFVNFPFGGLGDYLDAYYGANARCLRRVKEKYDPCNVFCFPQCISNC